MVILINTTAVTMCARFTTVALTIMWVRVNICLSRSLRYIQVSSAEFQFIDTPGATLFVKIFASLRCISANLENAIVAFCDNAS